MNIHENAHLKPRGLKRLVRQVASGHAIMARIEALRLQRFTGQQIARDLGVSPVTVWRVLRRLGLIRIAALEPAEPVRRYESECPGGLIHIDIKKLGHFERPGTASRATAPVGV